MAKLDTEAIIRKLKYMDVDANLLQENLSMINNSDDPEVAKRILNSKYMVTKEDRAMYDELEAVLGKDKFAELFFTDQDYYRWTSAVKKLGRLKSSRSKFRLMNEFNPDETYNLYKYEKTYRKFDKQAMEAILANPESPKNLKKFIQFNLDQDMIMIDYKKFIYESVLGQEKYSAGDEDE